MMKFTPILMFAMSMAALGHVESDQAYRVVPHRIVVKHPGIDANKPRPHSLSQALDERGYPVGYSMEVDSVVCLDGLCKVVRVMMDWDALGGFRGYFVADGSVLEKALVPDRNAATKKMAWTGLPGGIPSERDQAWAAFTEEDHAKLHRILRDRSSVLRTQRISELTGYRDKSRVDGMSGATPLTLREAVVEGAALSSYHLWHWANGGVGEAAMELTHQNCSAELLESFLARDDPRFILFALEHLQRHQLFAPSFVSQVIDVMSGGDQVHIDAGLAYLRSALPDSDAFYEKLARLFKQSDGETRIYLLGLLGAELTISGAQLDKFSEGLTETDTYYELHLFLNLIEKHQHVSEPLLMEVSRFLENENFFIARRAYWYLEKQSLNEQMAETLTAFQEKCARENRTLH
ncbi:hypothetical protein PDESU_02179 [Pontiella desulfatans]|uniref:Uncharacterized protein n=1 Tax=Pontiella desulfatans TaxID=2750659 RepID=A0A6C2U107_PONDE|nr:hypothetical protein [Pontiella desulfatans]VGO13622.1 hypothetical protein PDESU_02179 [Pontiella desulfatans]